MQPCSREMQAMNSILNQSQMYDLHQNNNQHNLDPTSHQQHDDFLEQMLSSIPSSWPPDLSTNTVSAASAAVSPLLQNSPLSSFEDQSTMLASKLRQHQIGGAAKALMLQQQLMLSRGLAAGNGLRSPTGHAAGNGGGLLPPMPLSLNGDHTDVVDDASPFKSANQVSFIYLFLILFEGKLINAFHYDDNYSVLKY